MYETITKEIAELVIHLAKANGMVREGNAFLDKRGNRYVACRMGLVDEIRHRMGKELIECRTKVADLSKKLEETSNANTLLKESLQNKKTTYKVALILEQNISDMEKIAEIKRYLNL